MPRRRSLKGLQAEIEQTKQKMVAAKQRYDRLAERLKSLTQEHDRAQADLIAAAFRKSGKSLEQLLTFLGR